MLNEEKNEKKGFRKIFTFDRYDLLIIAVHVVSCFFFWYILKKNSGTKKIHFHKAAAQNFVTASQPFSQALSNKYYQKYPVFPLVLKFFWFISFGNHDFGSKLCCLFFSVSSGLLFRRFLEFFTFKSEPIISSILLAFFPPAAVYARCIDSEYSFFMCLFFLLYLSTRSKTPLLYIIVLCLTLTNFLGFFAAYSISLFLAFMHQKRRASFTLTFGILGFFLLMIYHKIISGDFFFMFRNFNWNRLTPFHQLYKNSIEIATIREFFAYYGNFIFPFIGSLMLYPISSSLSIFSLSVLFLASTDVALDYFTYGLPGETISVLVGFSPLFRSKEFHNAMWILIPIYGSTIVYLESEHAAYSIAPHL